MTLTRRLILLGAVCMLVGTTSVAMAETAEEKGLRIARKEASIDLLNLPVAAPEAK